MGSPTLPTPSFPGLAQTPNLAIRNMNAMLTDLMEIQRYINDTLYPVKRHLAQAWVSASAERTDFEGSLDSYQRGITEVLHDAIEAVQDAIRQEPQYI